MEIFVARQPVFTAKKHIFGYELLFRSGLENAFPDIDGDTATSGVLANTFFSFGLNEILGGKPGLINFTQTLLRQQIPLLFPKDHIIIEVLENVDPDPAIIKALQAFKAKGFRVALDDFVYAEKFRPMMALSSMIKFDLMETPLDTLGPVLADIRSNFPAMTLLAEKVETHEEFEQAKEMGFGLFQGYFFSKPEILSKKEISAGQLTKLKLINEAGRMEPDLTRIEELIRKDVSVSFKLLKFINSAYFSRPSVVDTIRDAIVVLGVEELKKFVNIVVASDLNETKPNELIRASVIRARMCELCGTLLNTRFTTEELFTIGLFSSMDAILDMPMTQILEQVTFSDRLKEALLGKDKHFNQIRLIVVNFERGQWNSQLYKRLEGTKLIDKLPDFYLDAVRMANAFLA